MSGVSVVISVRDGERYVGKAIESVLAQTRAPAELVVVDDGSTDASAKVAAGFGDRVRVIAQKPAGIARAYNRGIEETGEELVAMLDADDLWIPNKLELQVAAIDADPELEAVFGYAREFISPELALDERLRLRRRAESVPWRSKGTILIRRAALERVGPFDPAWRVGDFVDWHARADELGLRSAMLERVVLHRRLHDRNYGRSDRADHVDYTRVARAALRRRRTAAG
jgi:glycosyltransferase involved in cell wall biosynthesis